MNKPCVAVVLAGGLGTRLRSVVEDLPKPMAPVAGVPFLEHILKYCISQGVEDVVLATGYRHEAIENHFGLAYGPLRIRYSIEKEPLGTGGGILKAFSGLHPDEPVLVLNGDTMFKADFQELYNAYVTNHADMAVSLCPMKDFDRYGTVVLAPDNRITRFIEKQPTKEGLINAGVYLLKPSVLQRLFSYPGGETVFSFEKNFMELYVSTLRFYGYICDAYFIDIGIPEDYFKAQEDFR